MNKYKVTIIYTDGRIKDVVVEGTDGPKFDGDNGMYKHLDCSNIEITGARYNNKNYELYIDGEGRLDYYGLPTFNPLASKYFVDWLDHEERMTIEPTIVGTAALVEREPINE